jgi:GNAT superfamily N-acetyltransferase
MITFDESLSGVAWASVAELFAAVGWGVQEPDELALAFSRSSHVMFAYEDGELIGTGRVVGDGRFYASLVDVAVTPASQARGIGTQIVRRLQEQLRGYVLVTLTAAPEVRRFYERLGWRVQTTGMLLPRDDKQAKLNCAPRGHEVET